MDFYGGFFVTDYDEMCDILTHELIRRERQRSLAIVILASARAEFTQKHLIRHVEYWNCRSKDSVDFFFPGYLGEASGDSEYATVNSEPDKGFDEATFVEVIERFEKAGWQYSGRPTMLVMEVILKQRRSDGDRRAFPNFSQYLEVPLESAIEDGVIESVATLFEQIIRFSKDSVGINAHWRLSDLLGGGSVGKALVDIVFENLPIKGVAKAVKPLNYFRLKGSGA